MAVNAGTAYVEILPKLDKFNTQLQRSVQGLSSKLSSAGKSLTKNLTLPVVAFIGVSAKALVRIDKINAQTQSALKSTGNAAGVTSQQIQNMAGALEDLTGIEAESIQEGQNLLLTFTNVKNAAGKNNDIFSQATRIMTDMSVAFGTDAKGSAIQLGKALNDPVRGITALTRVGVSFTEQQKEQIKKLAESGDVLGAQKIILKELNKEFGGSAKAFGKSSAGQLAKFGHAMGTLGESIAEFVLPSVVQLSEWLTKLAKKFSELSPSTRKLIAKILLIVAAVGPLLIVLGKLVGAFGMVANAVIGVTKLFAANPWLLLIAAVVALVIVIVKNWDKIKRVILGAWNHIKRATKRVWDGIKRGVGAAVDFLRDLFLNFTPVGQIVKHWGTIKRVILGVWDKLKGAFGSAKEFFSRIWNGVKAVTTTIWNAIGSVIKGVLNVIIRGINAFITGLNAVGAPLRLLGKIPGVPDIPSIPKIPELTRGGLVLETGLAVVHEGETFSGVDGARRQNPGALRLVEGTLRLDENGDAFIRAVIAEENEAEKDHSDSLARMRR